MREVRARYGSQTGYLSNVSRAALSIPLSDDAVRLASRLVASLADTQRLLLFTSASDAADVPAVAMQSALALARLVQQPILLVDGALDNAALHDSLATAQSPGLTEILAGTHSLETAAVRLAGATDLWFLPRGKEADYTLLLGSETARAQFQLMRQRFRFVVMNASSLLHSAPTSVLTTHADGVIAVVVAGRDHKTEVVELKRMLDGLKIRLIGAVLAMSDPDARGIQGTPQ